MQKGNDPIFEDKEGNIKLAIFRNKTKKGNRYATICLTLFKFPFKLSQKVYFNIYEKERIISLLQRMPEVETKEKKEIKTE